jgi:hypothetical protein
VVDGRRERADFLQKRPGGFQPVQAAIMHGVMEFWSIGNPLLHHSDTPSLHF